MKFSYQPTAGVNQREVDRLVKKLSPYLSELEAAADDTTYRTPESCLALPNDESLCEVVSQLVQKKKSPHLKEVFVIGIGGSSLGAVAVRSALRAYGLPISFYDTVDNHHIIQAIETIKRLAAEGRQMVVNIISKSGSTLETIANARVLIKVLQDAMPDWQKQVVVTSEPESALSDWANQQGIETLPNPPQVGGRFSVMSAVGLFPLALAGVEIAGLHKGGREADFKQAAESAGILYAHLQKGYVMHNMFLFDPDLEDLGKWHRQLIAESLGKDGKGLTPLVSVGSVDLHSTLQLYLSGPKDKFTTFVTINRDEGVKVPAVDEALEAIVPNITDKTLTDIMKAILAGAKGAYAKRGLPFASVEIEAANERELGAFMQFHMIQTMLLARLMGVNAFDQPAVEEYKVITKKLLAT